MRKLSILGLFIIIFFLSTGVSLAFPKDCVVINIVSRTLDLHKDGKIIKTFPVGVGRATFPTPTGVYKVISLVEDPGWENPYKESGAVRINAGNDNPLGTRWIGFKADPKGEYGIHGTDNPASVGKLSSHGCVRMKVADAEELYKHVQMHMPVIVKYETAELYVKDSKVYLKVYPDVYNRGETDIMAIKNLIEELDVKVLWNSFAAFNALKENKPTPVIIGSVIETPLTQNP